MANILIIRFSALGDVAMTVPVIKSLAMNYPMHEITVLSRQRFAPLFVNLPGNVRFKGVDFVDKHKGLKGLNTLYTSLKKESFDYVADFHCVLRSYYLQIRYRLDGVHTVSIHKGLDEKKKLTQKRNKSFVALKSTFVRYQEVLEKLGCQFQLNFNSIFDGKAIDATDIMPYTGEKNGVKWLGIAPFAKHKGKMYPLELQLKVIEHFANDTSVKVFLFGGGESEKRITDDWVHTFPSLVSVVDKLTLMEELTLMSQLDLMFSMDSANMHLASLVGTTVVSLWGATHPYAGFMGWNQGTDNAVQVELACRPCSVYGNKKCYRKDYACLYQITPEDIIRKIERNIIKNNRIIR